MVTAAWAAWTCSPRLAAQKRKPLAGDCGRLFHLADL
jgi:hypothetical protein